MHRFDAIDRPFDAQAEVDFVQRRQSVVGQRDDHAVVGVENDGVDQRDATLQGRVDLGRTDRTENQLAHLRGEVPGIAGTFQASVPNFIF